MGNTEEAASTPEAEKIKVGMVTDIGGLNDRSFNEAAYKGLQKAESELGVEIRALTSKAPTDYVPNLTSLARQQFDLIIAVGFLMAEDTEKIANQFPETNFAIIDSSQQAMKSKPKNLEGLLFKENEAGYLVGYMAGLYTKDKGGDQVVSTVGGLKIPPVDAYIAGFQKGARDANPKIETLNGYSEDFVDQAKCKEIALNQIAEGSQVVFQVAGGCGLGALDAAKQKGVQGIGVDSDQGFLGDQVMTSALKKIDEAVFTTIQEVQDGASRPARTPCSTWPRAASATARSTPRARSTSTRWTRSRPRSSRGRSRTSRPRSVGRTPDRAEHPARPRAEGRHQALRRAHRERPHRPRCASR